MYKDIISYELADGITQVHLLEVANNIITTWMKELPGFVGWDIHTSEDGSYTDVVFWESKEAAKNAEKEMGIIPNAAEWYGCYKPGSISSKNLTQIAKF